jgi:hypothetical protein
MKPKTIIVLAVLLAAGLYVLLRQGHRQPPQEPPDAEAALLAVQADQVRRINISGTQGEPLEIIRPDRQWELAGTDRGRADQRRCQELVEALTGLRGRLADVDEASLTGLDQPRWQVEIEDAQGARHALRVGKAAPLSGGAVTYVRTTGSPKVYAARRDLQELLDRDWTWYRDTLVLDLKPDQLTRIAVAGPAPYELVREDGRWVVRQDGRRVLADEGAVQRLLSRLTYLRARQFAGASVTAASAGLEPPQRVLQVEFVDQAAPATEPTEATIASAPAPPAESQVASSQPGRRTIVLELGSVAGYIVYARLGDRPEIFELSASELEALAPPAASAIDYRLLDVQADQVAAVELTIADRSMRLERTDAGWRVRQPVDWPARADRVEAMLKAATGLKAQQAPEQGEIDAHWQAGLKLITHDGREIRVEIGPASPSGYLRLASTSDQDRYGQVAAQSVEPLLKPLTEYLDPHLVCLEGGQELVQLDIQGRPDGDVELRRADGAWVTGSGQKADPGAAEEALAAVQSAAQEIVDVGSLPEELAEADGRLILRLGVAAPGAAAGQAGSAPATAASAPQTRSETAASQGSAVPVNHVIELAVAKKGPQVLAWREDLPVLVVARFDLSLYEALLAEMVRAAVLDFDPRRIVSVRLFDAGLEQFALQRHGKGWQLADEPLVQPDAAKVTDWLARLQALQPKRFVADPVPMAEQAAWRVELADEQGQTHALWLSAAQQAGYWLAGSSDQPRAFLMDAATVGRIRVDLSQLQGESKDSD